MKFTLATGCGRGLCRNSCSRSDRQLNVYDWLADVPGNAESTDLVEVSSVSISTADIDWNKYEQVELKIHMASSYSSCAMYMRFNGNDGSIYRTGVQGSNGIPVCSRGGESGFATVTLASSPAGKVMGYVLSTGLDGNVYWLAQPFAVPTLELNQVTSIQLYANGSSYLFCSIQALL